MPEWTVILIADLGSGPVSPGKSMKGLKKVPKPILAGGAVVVVLGTYMLVKKRQSAAASASNSTNATAPASVGDTSQSFPSGGGYGGYDYGGAGAFGGGGGSTGIDPTELASIIAALQGGGNGASPSAPAGVPNGPITINVGGGAPTSPVPGTTTAPPPGGSNVVPSTPPPQQGAPAANAFPTASAGPPLYPNATYTGGSTGPTCAGLFPNKGPHGCYRISNVCKNHKKYQVHTYQNGTTEFVLQNGSC